MRRYFIIIFLAILVVLSGCEKKETDNTLKTSFYGGIDGISITFKETAPPKQFNQGEEIPVAVILNNKGEYDVVSGNAKAKIYGISLDVFNLPDEYKGTTGILRGKGEFNIEGGEKEISFGNLKYNEEIINSRDSIIRANICYPYQTKTDIPVCIKSPLGEIEGNVCVTDGEKVVEGTVSSAPIQVTSVTEKTRGSDQVRFDIKIENKGTGKVYANDASCEELEDYQMELNKKDKIFIEIINPEEVKCGFASGEESNKGIVEMNNKEKIVSCWMETKKTYTDNLVLTLNYVYIEATSKDIKIFEK